jgi:signal transduction histidine kinase
MLAAAASLPLVWWRRHPLGVFVLTAAASAPLLGYQAVPPLGPTVALYLLAASRDGRHPWTRRMTLAVAVLFLIHLAAVGLAHDELLVVPLLFSTLGWTAAWFAGERTRLRRERLTELEDRAMRAETAAEQERRLAAAEERMRIARDLHDSAGHAINVILVQAGAARLLQAHDAAGTSVAIETIEEVARQTLGEIDQLVSSLREDVADGDAVETPSGLAALDTLVARHRANGLDVIVDIVGSVESARGRTTLPTTVDQAAYRILQESLTNAARHGSGGAHITLRYADRHIEITVTNPAGADGESIRSGHGLVGMHERAGLLGGQLDVNRSNGTFRVRAQLPIREVGQ